MIEAECYQNLIIFLRKCTKLSLENADTPMFWQRPSHLMAQNCFSSLENPSFCLSKISNPFREVCPSTTRSSVGNTILISILPFLLDSCGSGSISYPGPFLRQSPFDSAFEDILGLSFFASVRPSPLQPISTTNSSYKVKNTHTTSLLLNIMKTADLTVKILTVTSFVILIVNFILLARQYHVVNNIILRNTHVFKDDPHLERLPGEWEQVKAVVEVNDRFSLLDDTAWADTMPAKRGFVRLGPKGRPFAIALYHQIHCVNSLRFSYTVARDGLVTDPDVLKKKIPHDNHCFQFIRQSIMCRADNAIVPFKTNTTSLATQGFGSTHRCGNWAQIRQFVLDNNEYWDGKPFDISEGVQDE